VKITQFALTFALALVALTGITGCAVMSKDIPAWSTYSKPDGDNQLQLAYRSKGEGSPVLLIHGFGASSYSWRHLINPLAKNHRVITVDLKGFGYSPKPRDDLYSVYDQAKLVRDFIIEEKLEDINIVGHSFGGGVALVTSVYLTASHPGLIKRLVLIDSIAYTQDLPDFVELLATPVLGPLIVHLTSNQTQAKYLLKQVYFDDDLIPQSAIDHYAKIMTLDNAKYAIITGARQLIPPDLGDFSNRYPSIRTPTLIIWSKNDTVIPLRIGKRLHKALPHSKMVILETVGHAPQEEKPELVIPHLLEFLDPDHAVEDGP